MSYGGFMDLLHEFNVWCAKNDITAKEGAKRIGVSYPFLYHVLRFVKPCPSYLVGRLAKALGIEKNIVGFLYGYYPTQWLRAVRADPEKAMEMVYGYLEEEGFNGDAVRTSRLQKAAHSASKFVTQID